MAAILARACQIFLYYLFILKNLGFPLSGIRTRERRPRGERLSAEPRNVLRVQSMLAYINKYIEKVCVWDNDEKETSRKNKEKIHFIILQHLLTYTRSY